MQKKMNLANWALRIAAVLICLVLVTGSLLTGLMARYTTSSEDSDGARVAAFVFDVQAGELAVALPEINKPGDNTTVQITISNKRGNLKSEVAELYTMTIRELGNLPLTYTLTEVDEPSQESPIDGELQKNGTFAASVEETKTYELMVTWPGDNEYKDPKYAGGTAVLKLTITGEQVD